MNFQHNNNNFKNLSLTEIWLYLLTAKKVKNTLDNLEVKDTEVWSH